MSNVQTLIEYLFTLLICSPYNKYAFDVYANRPAFLWTSGRSNDGFEGPTFNYFDLETLTEVWADEASPTLEAINSLDLAGDLMGTGASVIVLATPDDQIEYYDAR